MKKTFLIAACLIGTALFVQSCKKTETTDPTLYERVGGTEKVTDPTSSSTTIEKGRLTLRSVTDSSLLVIAADPSLAKFFPVLFAELGANNSTGLASLSRNFTDFLCVATGSKNYSYTGKSMKATHNPATNNRMGEKADAADFDKFVGDIGMGLAKNGVTAANNKDLVNDLVALLNTTKSDVVQK